MTDAITVYKLDHRGREVWHYPARVLARAAHSIRLEAFFNRDDMALGYVTFKRGDRFVETFYADRWYNVFAIYDRDDGALKGWYCNVCRPAVISETAVSCDDLALDVWVSLDGLVTVLDEDEFDDLELTVEERQQATHALAQITALARAGQFRKAEGGGLKAESPSAVSLHPSSLD